MFSVRLVLTKNQSNCQGHVISVKVKATESSCLHRYYCTCSLCVNTSFDYLFYKQKMAFSLDPGKLVRIWLNKVKSKNHSRHFSAPSWETTADRRPEGHTYTHTHTKSQSSEVIMSHVKYNVISPHNEWRWTRRGSH